MIDADRLTRARGGVPNDGVGLGLRPALYRELESEAGKLDFLEAISDNFLESSGIAQANLRHFRRSYPLFAHGVGLNLLGTDGLDLEYLSRLRALVHEFELPHATDHLCWTAHRGVQHHELLPAPFSAELVSYVAERARYVQEFLGVPFGVENLSSYVTFRESDLTEWEFLRRVVVEADCFVLLDLNNIFVSSQNHGFSVDEYLEHVPWERVLYVHLAGHRVTPSGLLHDTHDQPIAPEVWELYQKAWKLGGPFPTLVEWDAEIPPLSELLQILEQAREVRSS
jgi:uncharacterized protein